MRRYLVVILVAAAFVPTANGQAPAAANPLSQAIRDEWNGVKQNVVKSASVMPADKYGFKPVASVRSFGQILAHLAGANYIFCAAAKGEKAPHTEDEFEKSATTAPAILKALQDSVAYCDAAYTALTDQRAVEAVNAPFGSGKTVRASTLMGNTGHLQEHYGNLVTYLRMNALVPPSSAQ
jgi:uncharacterized damage-inducible protein DinB